MTFHTEPFMKAECFGRLCRLSLIEHQAVSLAISTNTEQAPTGEKVARQRDVLSVPTVLISPFRSPSHSAAWCSGGRTGGTILARNAAATGELWCGF